MSLSHCIAARGEVEADNAASMVRMRVHFPIPGGNDSGAAAAVDIDTVVEAAAEVAAEAAAVDKRQVAVRNLVDSAADTEELAVRNSGVGNPADYIAPAARTPAAVASAGVRWVCDPRSPARQKV